MPMLRIETQGLGYPSQPLYFTVVHCLFRAGCTPRLLFMADALETRVLEGGFFGSHVAKWNRRAPGLRCSYDSCITYLCFLPSF